MSGRSNRSLLHARSRDFQPCVYITASRRNGTLYVGVTSNLGQRAWQHREGLLPGFTRKYGVKSLVFYEFHDSMDAAIRREKQIKEWHRAWKIELIESMNPDWRDLYEDLAGQARPGFPFSVTPAKAGVHRRPRRWPAGADEGGGGDGFRLSPE